MKNKNVSIKFESWKHLKIGDRIRLVQMPSEFNQPGYTIHRDTLRVYKLLIGRNRPVRIYKIDEFTFPWIQCRFQKKNSAWEYHSFAFNHDGWVRVKHKNRTKKTGF